MTRPGENTDTSISPPDATSPSNSYHGASESLIPWLKGLGTSNGSGPLSTSSSGGLPPLHTYPGSSSAPVTPPISSPRAFPVKPEWDSGAFPPAWTQYPSLAAAAVAAQASNQASTHFLVSCCDTPTGARTPVEGTTPCSEPVTLPATALEFANVCSPNSTKWANGIRVQNGASSSDASFAGHQWRNGPMIQKSISVPVSPVSSRMRSFMGERLTRCPSELDLSACPVQQKLGALWELDRVPETVGTKRKVTADDLELTLGNSSLRAL
ncbi:hypothetical protein M758_7G152300 [Ceratodon purpureus]|nr:hypothetical protein KC19_7G125800 [Ceratodon purpureus]KAG0611604.1 hypothetical protein M758_7G152300 [Ceratodon purpureus]